MPTSEVKNKQQKTNKDSQLSALNKIKKIDNNNVTLSDSSSDDELNWQYVPAKNRKRTNSQSPQIFKAKRQQHETGPSTSNRFTALASNNNENDIDDTSSEQPQHPKPPPILIPNVGDIAKMVSKLNKVVTSNEFYYKSYSDGQVRLNSKSVDSYRKIVKHFDDNKIVYHTYQLKQERAFTVVIKGLHHTTPIVDIKANLLLLGHQVRSVRNITSRETKNPLPMFFVDLEPNANNCEIYNTRTFGHAIVVVEAPKKFNDMVQCHRCQQFGHTKSYCKRPYSCVKCGLEHPTTECTKSPGTPPQCVHCLGNHTANYKGCVVYQKLINKRTNISPRNVNENGNFNVNANFAAATQNSGQTTYAQAVRGTNDGVNNVLQKIEAMLEKQIELTNTLMNMMSMLMTKLCK